MRSPLARANAEHTDLAHRAPPKMGYAPGFLVPIVRNTTPNGLSYGRIPMTNLQCQDAASPTGVVLLAATISHHDDDSPPPGRHVAPQPLRQSARRQRGAPLILIVDDDESISSLLADLLDDAGYRTLTANDAEMAFKLAAQSEPDLILTDYMMPNHDGVHLRHRLRADPRLSRIPFALMSSGRPRLPSLAGVPFLPKPFDIDDVITFVERYLHTPPTRLHGDG